jgi:hypothetical protein
VVTMKNDTHKDTHKDQNPQYQSQQSAAGNSADRDKVTRALEACRSRRNQAIGGDEARTLDTIMGILEGGSSSSSEPPSHTPHTPAT